MLAVIDKSGDWWKGQTFEDLVDYLRQHTAENWTAGPVSQARCHSCGTMTFRLLVDDDNGCAQRPCERCGKMAFIGDSEEFWEDTDPGEPACPCGSELFEVGIAFSLRENGDIRWITVGARCVRCGVSRCARGVGDRLRPDGAPLRRCVAGRRVRDGRID